MSRGPSKKKSSSSLSSEKEDSSIEVECIIAHVPYPEDVEPYDGSDCGHTLIREIECEPNLAEALRNKLVSFLRAQLNNGSIASTKRVVVPSKQPDTMVKLSSLPVHHIGVCDRDGGVVCCWWCTYEFSTFPFYLPHWVVDGTFHVTGNFCSYNCALAYNISIKDNTVCQRSNLLWILYNRLLTSLSIPPLPAPPRELLKRFGGWMTIEEFREHSSVLGHDVHLLLPPLQSVHYTIESQKRPSIMSSYSNTNAYVPLNNDSVTKARETLKLKRSAPKKTNYVSLEETMGIIKRPREVS